MAKKAQVSHRARIDAANMPPPVTPADATPAAPPAISHCTTRDGGSEGPAELNTTASMGGRAARAGWLGVVTIRPRGIRPNQAERWITSDCVGIRENA